MQKCLQLASDHEPPDLTACPRLRRHLQVRIALQKTDCESTFAPWQVHAFSGQSGECSVCWAFCCRSCRRRTHSHTMSPVDLNTTCISHADTGDDLHCGSKAALYAARAAIAANASPATP